jgi:glycerate 2-kinase
MDESLAKELISHILEEADLYRKTRQWLRGSTLNGRVHVVAIGKGAISMAAAAEDELGPNIVSGVAVVPRGTPGRLRMIPIIESTHPLPSEASLEAAHRILSLLEKISEGDVVLFLISGGGSALVELPVEGVSLDDLRRLNDLMIRSGATINEINAVRKHISMVKGGQLGRLVMRRGGRVVSLLASDVPGDDPATIASGPTVPDPTTYGDAIASLRRNGVWDAAPPSVKRVLEEGERGLREETPKELGGAITVVVASNMDVLRGVAEWLEKRGHPSLILTSRMEGEAREVGRFLASIALDSIGRGVPLRRGIILVGGEPTVTVVGNGVGGRTTEMCTGFALSVRGVNGVGLLALATDGLDGNMGAAGCIADGNTINEARARGIDAAEELRRNNTAAIYEATGSLIRTGLTGSNLNIVAAIIIDDTPHA